VDLKELIAKLNAKVAKLAARQRDLLAESQADGVSDEDKAKKLKEFDDVQAEREAAKADLRRAEGLYADEQTPRVAAVVQPPHNPHAPSVGVDVGGEDWSAANIRVPARCRRHNALKVFKGRDGEREAYAAGLFYAGRPLRPPAQPPSAAARSASELDTDLTGRPAPGQPGPA
jgi:hypothetical protein